MEDRKGSYQHGGKYQSSARRSQGYADSKQGSSTQRERERERERYHSGYKQRSPTPTRRDSLKRGRELHCDRSHVKYPRRDSTPQSSHRESERYHSGHRRRSPTPRGYGDRGQSKIEERRIAAPYQVYTIGEQINCDINDYHDCYKLIEGVSLLGSARKFSSAEDAVKNVELHRKLKHAFVLEARDVFEDENKHIWAIYEPLKSLKDWISKQKKAMWRFDADGKCIGFGSEFKRISANRAGTCCPSQAWYSPPKSKKRCDDGG